MTINVGDIAVNITNEIIGKEIYNNIVVALNANDTVILDFSKVNVITTYCAKQIFRKLLDQLGEEKFNKSIKFINITPMIEYEINMGLND